MFRTVCIKQWPEIRGRIWTYPVVVLFLSLFWQESNFFFLTIVGTFLALDMAVQAAGDDVRWGTFEFIFTRAIDRKKYLSLRFLFGLLPLAGVVALYVLLEFIDIRIIFWNLISEPVEEFAVQEVFGAGYYILAALTFLFQFSLVFLFCTTASRESSFSSYIVIGLIASIVYVLLTAAVTSLILYNTWNSGTEMPSDPPFVLIVSAFLLLPSLVFFVLSREYYSRCEIPDLSPGESRTAWTSWLVLALAIILILFFLFYMLSATRTTEATGG